MKKIETITQTSFSNYGTILEFAPEQKDSRFEVLITEPENPWRLAVFRVRNKSLTKLECHPTSMESFEPLSGTGILLVAEPSDPDNYRAFLLDHPVCLKKGVWHDMITITEETTVKIAENLQVNSVFHELKSPISLCIAEMEK